VAAARLRIAAAAAAALVHLAVAIFVLLAVADFHARLAVTGARTPAWDLATAANLRAERASPDARERGRADETRLAPGRAGANFVDEAVAIVVEAVIANLGSAVLRGGEIARLLRFTSADIGPAAAGAGSGISAGTSRAR